MTKRKIKKSFKIVFIFIILVMIVLICGYFMGLFEKETLYDDQYIDGIVFSDISYKHKKISFCHHNLLDNQSDSLFYLSFDDNKVEIDSLKDECSTMQVDFKPQTVTIIDSNNEKSVLSNKDKEDSFNKCDNKSSFPYEDNEELSSMMKSLDSYLSRTTAAVYYENIENGFSYGYNEDVAYYGASLIKLPEALYLFDEAIKGNISLNEKVTLDSYYYNLGNDELKTNKVNSQIEIGKLIKYMLETSDNGAHLLLFDTYAGKYLTEYEKSLGSTHPFTTGSDKFGQQTALATNVYLKHAYEMIMNNDEYGSLLKKYLTNDYMNNLKLDDGIEVAHKYGQITKNPKLHDIGIVFNKHPYTISVLTYYNQTEGSKFINNIHKRIKELHEKYYTEKTNYCISNVYFNNI